jgi:hypothetical protein
MGGVWQGGGRGRTTEIKKTRALTSGGSREERARFPSGGGGNLRRGFLRGVVWKEEGAEGGRRGMNGGFGRQVMALAQTTE